MAKKDKKKNAGDAELKPETKKIIEVQTSVLEKHAQLLSLIIGIIMGHPACTGAREEQNPIEPPVSNVIGLMLISLGNSIMTLIALSNPPSLKSKDGLSVARSVVESSINICYILAGGSSIAERAIRHANQKMVRDLQREAKIRDFVMRLSFEPAPDLSDIDGLDEMIDEFTSNKGREKGWTDLSVDDRIAFVGEEFGSFVMGLLGIARFTIYRHSSEILHGTYFGALYSFGQTQPRAAKETMSIESFSEDIGGHCILALTAGISSAIAVVEAFHLRYGFSKVLNDSKSIRKELGSAYPKETREKT